MKQQTLPCNREDLMLDLPKLTMSAGSVSHQSSHEIEYESLSYLHLGQTTGNNASVRRQASPTSSKYELWVD